VTALAVLTGAVLGMVHGLVRGVVRGLVERPAPAPREVDDPLRWN